MIKKPRMVDQRVRYGLIRGALPPAPARVCELGVGGGWLLHSLHEDGYDVHGCDVSLKDFPLNSPIADRILQTSGARLPFPDNHFDATYSCDVLEHVYPAERAAFLAELVRITKPGGVVALTAFFRNTISFRLWGVGYLLFRGTLPAWYTEHLTIPLPSEEETFAQLSQALVGVRRVRYQGSLNILIMWFQAMSPRQRHLARLFDIPSFLIPCCDVIGSTTSAFFTGLKPK
jgi:ubiquinone/menaquinone biosynthesis C-methylase UbiE